MRLNTSPVFPASDVLVFVTAVATLTAGSAAAGQEGGGSRVELMATSAISGPELRRLDVLLDAMVQTGELVLAGRAADRQLPGRIHEGFRQYHQGVPVYGGSVARQLAGGVAVSILGTLHQGIDIDTSAGMSAAEALALMEQRAGAGPATADPPSLVVVNLFGLDEYVLAYRATMRDRQTWFLDAHSGRTVHVESEVDAQNTVAVGAGDGLNGDRKKVSASRAGGSFQAYDRLRPAEIVTLDLAYDEDRADSLLDPGGSVWRPSDVASDTDNEWDDPAVVDGHAHIGFTYDYLWKRHSWNGMDGADGRILSMVNIERDFANAFFIRPPFGPEGTGAVAFGEKRDGTPVVPLDIVAHEVMHGVTYFSVNTRTGRGLLNTIDAIPGPSGFRSENGSWLECGRAFVRWRGRRLYYLCDARGRYLLFMAHGGAINEAYSDIVGTAVEFFIQEPGDGPNRADYVMGEDVDLVGRSLARPRSIRLSSGSAIRYPDAFGRGVRFIVAADDEYALYSFRGSVDGGRTIVRLPSFGYSGIHWNSAILSHAFYLAIEGGRNQTTGHTVEGVGAANRQDVERAFFRAMTVLMPAAARFQTAAAAIRQSAVDLFGAGSTTHRSVHQALRAVGL